jgi:ribosomal protein L16/L10AE
MRGTTVVWGDYGLRMTDHHRRLTALQLRNAEETIKKKLRGMKYRLYTRISANIPVYTKGNEVRRVWWWSWEGRPQADGKTDSYGYW